MLTFVKRQTLIFYWMKLSLSYFFLHSVGRSCPHTAWRRPHPLLILVVFYLEIKVHHSPYLKSLYLLITTSNASETFSKGVSNMTEVVAVVAGLFFRI